MNPRFVRILAKVISFFSYPLITFPLVVGIGIVELVSKELVSTVFLLVLLSGILPVIFLIVYLRKKGEISDWDIRKREERTPVNLSGLLAGTVTILIMWKMGIDSFLPFLVVLMIGMGAFTLITFKWKISGHTAGITLLCWLAVYYYDLPATVSLFTVMTVAWSRVQLKNHTLMQTAGGAVLASIVYYTMLYLHLI